MEEKIKEIKERALLIEKEFKNLSNNIKQGLKLDLLKFEKWNANEVWQWIQTIQHSQTNQFIFNTNEYSFVFLLSNKIKHATIKQKQTNGHKKKRCFVDFLTTKNVDTHKNKRKYLKCLCQEMCFMCALCFATEGWWLGWYMGVCLMFVCLCVCEWVCVTDICEGTVVIFYVMRPPRHTQIKQTLKKKNKDIWKN